MATPGARDVTPEPYENTALPEIPSHGERVKRWRLHPMRSSLRPGKNVTLFRVWESTILATDPRDEISLSTGIKFLGKFFDS